MKKYLIVLILFALPALSIASEGGVKLEKADIALSDKASLQNGARIFVNYCLSCHSAEYMRYNRMGEDLGLTPEQVKKNLMFASNKIGNTMTIAMPAAESKKWFGTTPPDLSDIARAKGADWLYTYLKSFYLDPSRPTGVNNTVFKDVGMPNVLWDLEGYKKAIYETHKNEEGTPVKTIVGFEQVTTGKLTPVEFDKNVRDLVNFLVYLGEPAKLQRGYIGVWVLLFLGVFFVVAYFMKKEFWKDIH